MLGGELQADPPPRLKTNRFDYEQTSENSFGRLHCFLCKKYKWCFLLVFWTYLAKLNFIIYIFFTLPVVISSLTTCCQSLAKFCFVATLPLSKWKYFWTVASNFYNMTVTCCMSCVMSACYPVLQNTTFTTTRHILVSKSFIPGRKYTWSKIDFFIKKHLLLFLFVT